MQCPSCHTSIAPGDRFCQNCGQVIAAPVPAAAATPTPQPSEARQASMIPLVAFMIVVAVVVAVVWPMFKTWLAGRGSKAPPAAVAASVPPPGVKSGTLTESPVATPVAKAPEPKTPAVPPPTASPFTTPQLIGSWRGGRHLTEFRADGTFLLDADIVPEPASGVWKLEGRRLTQTYREGNAIVLDILSIAEREMVTRDPQNAQEFKFQREDNAYLNPDTLPSGDMSGDEFKSKGLRMKALKGKLAVFDAGPPMAMPGVRKKVIIVDGGFVSAVAFEFDPPVRSFTITLPGVTGGSSFPTFKMTAFNRAGVGYDVIGMEHWIPDKPATTTLTMNSGEIARIELDVDNRFGDTAWATFNCLPIMDMMLER